MVVLTIQIVLIIFVGIISSRSIGAKRNDNVLLYFSFCSMWIVHTMVAINSVPDLGGYQVWFEMTRNQTVIESMESGLIKGMEIGYVLFNKIISFFTLDFRVLLGIYNIILIGLYLSFIKRYSPYVLVSILFLLLGDYTMSFYVLRQHIAMSLFVASLPLIIEKKIIPYLLVCVLAFSFHQTALICVPIIFLYLVKNRKLLIGIIIGALIFGGGYLAMFYNSDAEIMSEYASQLDASQEGTNNTPLILSLIYYIIYLLSLKKKVFEEGGNKLFFILLSINVILCATGIGFSPTVRLSLYFSLTTIAAFPLAVSYIKDYPIRYALILLVLGMELYRYIYGTGSDVREYIKFIFE